MSGRRLGLGCKNAVAADAGKAKDASKAFNSAVTHFNKALEYLAAAAADELNADQKQGQKMLDKGSKELDQSAKELDKGNIDAAQKHFDDGLVALQEGMDLLS